MAEQRPHKGHGIYGYVFRCLLLASEGEEVVKTTRCLKVSTCWSLPKKPMNSPGAIHPGEPGSEPMARVIHPLEGHVRVAETFLSETISRFPPVCPPL